MCSGTAACGFPARGVKCTFCEFRKRAATSDLLWGDGGNKPGKPETSAAQPGGLLTSVGYVAPNNLGHLCGAVMQRLFEAIVDSGSASLLEFTTSGQVRSHLYTIEPHRAVDPLRTPKVNLPRPQKVPKAPRGRRRGERQRRRRWRPARQFPGAPPSRVGLRNAETAQT